MQNDLTRRTVLGGAAAAGGSALLLSLAGCAPKLGGGSSSASSTIKLGYVTPRTGSLAPFGEADTFVLAQMTAYFAKHGITTSDGKKHPVQIIAKDTQSDSNRASDVANDLILKNNVDMVLASSTPDTVNPVADQCEANGVPCVSTVAPWQAYYFGRGGTPDKSFKWTYHFFWGLEDAEVVYADMWRVAKNRKRVGLLLPNDSDGKAWADPKTGFPAFITKQGMTPDNPGAFPDGTTDFSAQIAKFKANGDSILTAIPIPPDFTTFWKQAVQQGYHPEVVTSAKAILFPSAVEALGKLGNNLSTEVWWAPTSPFASSLTGQSAAQFAAAFTKGTGKQWTQPLGFAAALFEVANAAFKGAKSTDASAVRDSLAKLKVDTIVGTIDWTSGPVPNVSKTPLAGGQWRLQPDGKYELLVVSNSLNPKLPKQSEPQRIDWSAS